MSGIDDAGPLFLPSSIIHRLHARSLAEHGGLEGIGDPSGLESAITAPQNVHFYEGGDLFEIAAAYAFHIAESQAFLDGNKRTAASAALTFLEINGVDTEASEPMALHEHMIAIAKSSLNRSGLAEKLRKMLES